MNKGLYKGNKKYLLFLKTWENSTKNSGVTLSDKSSDWAYKIYEWQNVNTDRDSFKTYLGAACLAQW